MPGETVIPTDMSKKYGALINGMIADNIPGYAEGKKRAQAIFNQKMIDELYASIGLEDTAKIRIPLPTTSPSYSVSGIMAPKTVNTKKGGIGMDKQYLSSPMGRDALSASIQVEIEALGTSAKRTSQVLNEISPQLDTAVNEFDDTIEGWKKASTKAIENIESSKTLTPQEKSAIRKRLAPIDPTDYTVPSDPVLEIKKQGSTGGKGKGTPRNERKDSAYRDAAQKKILKAKGYDTEGLVFAHMPGYEKIEGQQRATMRPPTAGGKILTGDSLARVEAVREKVLLNKGFSKAQLDKIAKEDAASYKAALERGTQDPYVSSRKRKSPHPLAAKDGADDGKAYATAIEKSIARQNRKLAKKGNSSVGGNVNGGTTILAAPSRISRAKGAAGKIGSKFAGKTAGLGMAGSAAMMAGSFLPGKAGQVAQAAMPVAFGLQALQMALKLPIPHLKAVALGAAGIYGMFKLINSLKEKERLAIEGLGDAATVSEKKLKTLGDFFGIVPTKVDFLSRDFAPETTGTSSQQQTQIDTLQKDKNFQKDFKNDIESLRKGNNKQAKLVFDSIAIQLRGSGFAKEQIDLIIKALQEESGKTDFKFNFANIDLSTDKGILNFDKNFNAILKEVDSGITQAYTRMKTFDKRTNKWVGGVVNTISEEAKVNLQLAADAATGFMNGLRAQLESGTISADQFAQGFGRIRSSIATLPKPDQIILLNEMMKILPENLQKAASGITGTGNRLLIMEAQALGLTGALAGAIDAMGILESAVVFGPDDAIKKYKAGNFLKEFEAMIAKRRESFARIAKAGNPATDPYRDPDSSSGAKSLTDEEKYLKILEKQINALEAKRDAQKKINDEIQREIDLVNKLEDLSSQAVNAKISGNYIQAAMFGQQSVQLQAEFDRQTYLNTQQEPIDKLIARKQEIQDGSKLTSSEKAQLPKKTAKKANGGLIRGPGTGRSDSIRATMGYAGGGSIRVSNGEFIVKAASVRDYGVNAMNAVNNGTANIDTNSGGTVYNINMPITSNSSDPKAVGDYVIRKLKVEIDKNNKSNRINI